MKNSLIVAIAVLTLVGMCCAANNASPAVKIAVVNPQSALLTSDCGTHAPCASATAAMAPGEGAPMPICQPGQNCGDPVVQIAGEGAPIPICQPGQNCGDRLQLLPAA
jgi:hypothetical protein